MGVDPIVVQDRHDVQLHPELRAVLAVVDELHPDRPPPLQGLLDLLPRLGVGVRPLQDARRLAPHVLQRVAGRPREGLVDVDDPRTGLVHRRALRNQDRVVGVLDHGAQEAQLLPLASHSRVFASRAQHLPSAIVRRSGLAARSSRAGGSRPLALLVRKSPAATLSARRSKDCRRRYASGPAAPVFPRTTTENGPNCAVRRTPSNATGLPCASAIDTGLRSSGVIPGTAEARNRSNRMGGVGATGSSRTSHRASSDGEKTCTRRRVREACFPYQRRRVRRGTLRLGPVWCGLPRTDDAPAPLSHKSSPRRPLHCFYT